jgi:hypothetical protein
MTSESTVYKSKPFLWLDDNPILKFITKADFWITFYKLEKLMHSQACLAGKDISSGVVPSWAATTDQE